MGVVESRHPTATAHVRMSFDAIAPHYRWLEFVTAGNLLQRCRTAFLHEFKDAQNILLLGEGRGRFLAELLSINSSARITCLDASSRMLELTRSSLQQRKLPKDRVRFVHADALSAECSAAVPAARIDSRQDQSSLASFSTTGTSAVSVEKQYDAVASHFFLDCFQPTQLCQLIAMVDAFTAPGARWFISDFCVPEHGWQRTRARFILAALYGFFRAVTKLPTSRLTSPDVYLRQAGFQLQQRRHFNRGLLHSDVWVKGKMGLV